MEEHFDRSKLYKSTTWHDSGNGIWEYGNYFQRYFIIRQLDNNTFRPLVNGRSPVSTEFALPTLEEAKQYLFDYVDKMMKEDDERLSDEYKKMIIKNYIDRNNSTK